MSEIINAYAFLSLKKWEVNYFCLSLILKSEFNWYERGQIGQILVENFGWKCWWKYIWYPPAFTKIYHLLGVWSTLSLPLPLSLSWSHHVYRDSDYISSPCLCVDNVDDDDDHEAHGEQAICLLVSLHIAICLPLTYIVTCVIIIAAKTTSWIVFLSLTCCDFELLTKQDMAVFSQKYPDNFGCSLIQLSSRGFYHHWQQNRGQTDFFHLNFHFLHFLRCFVWTWVNGWCLGWFRCMRNHYHFTFVFHIILLSRCVLNYVQLVGE